MPNTINQILETVWLIAGIFGIFLFRRMLWRTRATLRYLKKSGKNGFRKIFAIGRWRMAVSITSLQGCFLLMGAVPLFLHRPYSTVVFTGLLLIAQVILLAVGIGSDRNEAQMEAAITQNATTATVPHATTQETQHAREEMVSE